MPRTGLVWIVLVAVLLTRCSADRTPTAPRRASNGQSQGKGRGAEGFGGAGGGSGLADSAAEPSQAASPAPMGKMAPKPSKAGREKADEIGAEEDESADAEASDSDSNLQEIIEEMDVSGQRKSPTGANLDKRDPAVRAAEREIHYDGTLQYRTNSGTEILTMIEGKVKSLGGYAERRAPDSAKFQVPQKSFLALYNELLKLPNLSSHSLEAADITDQFHDAEMRLTLARASLARLEHLLKQTKNARERLAILRQISRQREMLEMVESEYKELAGLAAFSSLSITIAEPDRTFAGQRLAESFSWIADLHPTQRALEPLWDRVKEAAVPVDFVVAKGVDYWRAESASGSYVTIAKAGNNPAGTADFWAKAIASYWATMNLQATTQEAGALRIVQYPTPSAPYKYYVGVATDKKRLYLVEIFYPSKEDQDRLSPAVAEAMKRWTPEYL